MKRLKYSLLAAAGILLLAFVLTAVGPKRLLAAIGYTPVRDVDNPGRQPFEHEFNRFGPLGLGPFTVQAGKRLVITGITGISQGTAQESVDILTEYGGEYRNHYVRAESKGVDAYTYQAGYVLAFADAGTSVYLVNAGSDNGGLIVTVTGYLVDVP